MQIFQKHLTKLAKNCNYYAQIPIKTFLKCRPTVAQIQANYCSKNCKIFPNILNEILSDHAETKNIFLANNKISKKNLSFKKIKFYFEITSVYNFSKRMTFKKKFHRIKRRCCPVEKDHLTMGSISSSKALP